MKENKKIVRRLPEVITFKVIAFAEEKDIVSKTTGELYDWNHFDLQIVGTAVDNWVYRYSVKSSAEEYLDWDFASPFIAILAHECNLYQGDIELDAKESIEKIIKEGHTFKMSTRYAKGNLYINPIKKDFGGKKADVIRKS